MSQKNRLKLIAYLLVTILFLGIVFIVEAQPREPAKFPPNQLKPVSQVFINGLSDLGNIQVFTTFQCGSGYRADWDADKGGIWIKLTGKAFAFYGADGLLHIHAFTADPPSAIHGFTPGIKYSHIPDYSLQDVDGNVPIEVFQYRSWYRRWQTRPCVDITESLLTIPKYAAAWKWLVEHNQTEAIRYLLQEMGLEADTGLPPYASASYIDLPTVENFADKLSGIESTEYIYMQPITNEGIGDWAEYNDGQPFIPFSPASLSQDDIVSEPVSVNSNSVQVTDLLTFAALVLAAAAAVAFSVSMIARNRAEKIKRIETERRRLIKEKQKAKQ